MNAPHQHKTEKAMQGLDGMQRAEAPPFLYGRIVERLKQSVPEPVYYTAKVLVRFALALFLMAALNAATIRIVTNAGSDEQKNLGNVAQEYFGSHHVNNYTY